MTEVKIGLAQMRSEKGDWAGNLERVEEYMAQARDEGCEIVVFPEMSLSGYCDPAKFPDAVGTLESPWVRHFVELTGKYRMVASAGFIEANGRQKPFITQVLARDGRIIGVYRKRHIVDEEAEWFSAGESTPVFDVGLNGGRIRLALAICADSDNPQIFADAARGGAQVVLHSSAPGLYERREDEAGWRSGFDWYKSHLGERLPLYAREHGLYIAVATQTGATVDEDFPGGSFVFGPDGECLPGSENWDEMLLCFELDLPDYEMERQEEKVAGM
ncbi:MAG: carbon-nitrogen hydrolase family protein [Chloroflexota bacterium]